MHSYIYIHIYTPTFCALRLRGFLMAFFGASSEPAVCQGFKKKKGDKRQDQRVKLYLRPENNHEYQKIAIINESIRRGEKRDVGTSGKERGKCACQRVRDRLGIRADERTRTKKRVRASERKRERESGRCRVCERMGSNVCVYTHIHARTHVYVWIYVYTYIYSGMCV